MNEREIFAELLDRSDPADRAAFLDQACGADADLRQRVESLWHAHQDAGSFLEKAPAELEAAFQARTDQNPESLADDAAWRSLLTPTDKPDRLGLIGNYEVIELVGRGGMGVVLRAFEPKLNRIVAIKLLAPELTTSPLAVRRFLREARAAAAVSHDHVVTIFAIDEDRRPPLIVMEYIGGQSLQQKLDRVGALDVRSILRIGAQTAAGLQAAHRQGLVHRDVKPANILLENGIERVKLTDFGLARAIDDIGMTRTGQITGTPQYMSPEQAQGERIDHRSDLFSLGCVMYAMCTGRAAFRADSAVAVMHQIVHQTPKPIRALNEDIPDWLVAIVDRLLAKNPDDRFATAAEVEELLHQHLAHLQRPDVNPRPADLARSPAAAVAATPSSVGSLLNRSMPWMIGLAVFVLLLWIQSRVRVERAKGEMVSEVIAVLAGLGAVLAVFIYRRLVNRPASDTEPSPSSTTPTKFRINWFWLTCFMFVALWLTFSFFPAATPEQRLLYRGLATMIAIGGVSIWLTWLQSHEDADNPPPPGVLAKRHIWKVVGIAVLIGILAWWFVMYID